MKNFSKILAVIICLMLVFAFVSCDNGVNNNANPNDTSETGGDTKTDVSNEDPADVDETDADKVDETDAGNVDAPAVDDNAGEAVVPIDEQTFLSAFSNNNTAIDLNSLDKIRMTVSSGEENTTTEVIAKDGNKFYIYYKVYSEEEIYCYLDDTSRVWRNGAWVSDDSVDGIMNSIQQILQQYSIVNTGAVNLPDISYSDFTYDFETGTFNANKTISLYGMDISNLSVSFEGNNMSSMKGDFYIGDSVYALSSNYEYNEDGLVSRVFGELPMDVLGIRVNYKNDTNYFYDASNHLSALRSIATIESYDPTYSSYVNRETITLMTIEYGLDIVMPE